MNKWTELTNIFNNLINKAKTERKNFTGTIAVTFGPKTFGVSLCTSNLLDLGDTVNIGDFDTEQLAWDATYIKLKELEELVNTL